MDIKTIRQFNKKLARVYASNIFLSIVAGALNYYCFNNNKILYFSLILNGIALIFFQPWKIMSCLTEGYGYKKGLETIAQERGITDV